ncbi:ribonuclease H2 subunit B-like [Tigriopus californicus]|uniref:ribonuclease H2 subunit B-like n=1 Tax=Tigriopus californicus TaxID=6832 RepID=UPI0027DA2415|nr:ribonuclease H2 subunit B-like [Tigriopus californicus]|eukprot:TCALIF_05864-PA protein Name:"Similar to rnaseh2b Ribonuclease H2 subunit B (Xenopus laevis)" AED:0.23 eAED:0.23 QI:276/1/1/1/1/1/4/148/347
MVRGSRGRMAASSCSSSPDDSSPVKEDEEEGHEEGGEEKPEDLEGPNLRRPSNAASRTTPPDHVASGGQWKVMVAPHDFMQTDQQPELIRLPHPQSGRPASFVIDAKSTQLCEVIAWREDHRAWFVDQLVESDGALYLVSPFDPLFIVLSYLKRSKQLQPLDHVVQDQSFPHLNRILSPHFLRHMNQIAQPKGSADLNVWQFDAALTSSYLSRKVRRLSKALQRAKVNVSGSARSEQFVQSGCESVDEAMYLRYAYQTLSMYLDEELGNQLKTHLGIPDTPQKRAPPAELTSEAKKQKKPASCGPIEDYSKGYKQAVIKAEPRSARQKALARSATGSKNIMAFFQKK